MAFAVAVAAVSTFWSAPSGSRSPSASSVCSRCARSRGAMVGLVAAAAIMFVAAPWRRASRTRTTTVRHAHRAGLYGGRACRQGRGHRAASTEQTISSPWRWPGRRHGAQRDLRLRGHPRRVGVLNDAVRRSLGRWSCAQPTLVRCRILFAVRSADRPDPARLSTRSPSPTRGAAAILLLLVEVLPVPAHADVDPAVSSPRRSRGRPSARSASSWRSRPTADWALVYEHPGGAIVAAADRTSRCIPRPRRGAAPRR